MTSFWQMASSNMLLVAGIIWFSFNRPRVWWAEFYLDSPRSYWVERRFSKWGLRLFCTRQRRYIHPSHGYFNFLRVDWREAGSLEWIAWNIIMFYADANDIQYAFILHSRFCEYESRRINALWYLPWFKHFQYWICPFRPNLCLKISLYA
jgi:hypothetical protein